MISAAQDTGKSDSRAEIGTLPIKPTGAMRHSHSQSCAFWPSLKTVADIVTSALHVARTASLSVTMKFRPDRQPLRIADETGLQRLQVLDRAGAVCRSAGSCDLTVEIR